ncbi:hypothetical protein MMC07_004921 [Pseudocyphellaria aurata]|nr:hypothetical protein [Pseudocyphellaria aurata]
MEDFHRYNLVVSPLVQTSSNEALSPLSDSLVSPATTADLISENSTSIGASSNVFTLTLNPRLDLFSHTCSRAYEDIGPHQILPSHESRMPGSNCSGHILITTEDLVAILGHANYLNPKWKHHLDQSPGRDERFALSASFEEGLESGTLPTTFEETFASMHVVHPCARCYHTESETSFWHGLFMDVLQRRYAITTREDSILFVQVAFEIWADRECSSAEIAIYSLNFVSQISWGRSQPSTHQATRGCELFYEIDKLDLTKLRDLLGAGEGIRVCTGYSGGFVYAKICTRNIVEASQVSLESETPLTTDTQTYTIDKPLQRERADTPDGTLVETQPNLRSGPLPNPDEANAKLAPSSPAEIAPPISSTSLACRICGKSFKAKKVRDQRGSLRRHMKTKHALKKKSYPCHVPGCGKTFPRPDNRRRHVRSHHKGVNLPVGLRRKSYKKAKDR